MLHSSSKKIVRGFKAPLSIRDWISREKNNNDKWGFNNAINQVDLIDIEHYTEQMNNTQSLQLHMKHSAGLTIGYKTSINWFKNVEILQSASSDHREWSYKSVTEGKVQNTQVRGN